MVTKGYGFTIEQIDWSCPSDLEPYADAHKLQMAEMDNYVYSVFGTYGISALIYAIEHNLAKNPKSEYIKEPILKITTENKEELSKEQIQKEVDLFFAREKARRVNFKRKKRCEDNE